MVGEIWIISKNVFWKFCEIESFVSARQYSEPLMLDYFWYFLIQVITIKAPVVNVFFNRMIKVSLYEL